MYFALRLVNSIKKFNDGFLLSFFLFISYLEFISVNLWDKHMTAHTVFTDKECSASADFSFCHPLQEEMLTDVEHLGSLGEPE